MVQSNRAIGERHIGPYDNGLAISTSPEPYSGIA